MNELKKQVEVSSQQIQENSTEDIINKPLITIKTSDRSKLL